MEKLNETAEKLQKLEQNYDEEIKKYTKNEIKDLIDYLRGNLKEDYRPLLRKLVNFPNPSEFSIYSSLKRRTPRELTAKSLRRRKAKLLRNSQLAARARGKYYLDLAAKKKCTIIKYGYFYGIYFQQSPQKPEVEGQKYTPDIKSQTLTEEVKRIECTSEFEREIHSPDIESPIHTPDIGSPIHSPEIESPIHTPDIGSPIHTSEIERPIHTPEIDRPIHTTEVENQLFSPEDEAQINLQDQADVPNVQRQKHTPKVVVEPITSEDETEKVLSNLNCEDSTPKSHERKTKGKKKKRKIQNTKKKTIQHYDENHLSLAMKIDMRETPTQIEKQGQNCEQSVNREQEDMELTRSVDSNVNESVNNEMLVLNNDHGTNAGIVESVDNKLSSFDEARKDDEDFDDFDNTASIDTDDSDEENGNKMANLEVRTDGVDENALRQRHTEVDSDKKQSVADVFVTSSNSIDMPCLEDGGHESLKDSGISTSSKSSDTPCVDDLSRQNSFDAIGTSSRLVDRSLSSEDIDETSTEHFSDPNLTSLKSSSMYEALSPQTLVNIVASEGYREFETNSDDDDSYEVDMFEENLACFGQVPAEEPLLQVKFMRSDHFEEWWRQWEHYLERLQKLNVTSST